MNIFKAYDIRGIYPTEINDEIAYKVGRAIVEYLQAKHIAVGCDNRTSSPSLYTALTRGITDAGAEVINVGLISTPMLYFASATLDTDGAVMVTASHNPSEYNGFKICSKNAVAIGKENGLNEIELRVDKNLWATPPEKGSISSHDIKKEYTNFIQSFASLNEKHFSIATDTAHAMGVLELPILRGISGITLPVTLYDTLEAPGVCPHEANPVNQETLVVLQRAVVEAGADMGIAFDGDADRIGFVDEQGSIVPMDLVTALLASSILPDNQGGIMLYDLRSSRAVKEKIESLGGIAYESKVGHANIKKQMIQEGALLAGEASGHYYFTLHGYTAEMGVLPAIYILNLMAKTGEKLSALVANIKKYAHSGEINFRVEDPFVSMEKIKEKYSDGTLSTLDGIKISYPEWWFSLRSSNTEPLLRLNVEAVTQELLDQKTHTLLSYLAEK